MVAPCLAWKARPAFAQHFVDCGLGLLLQGGIERRAHGEDAVRSELAGIGERLDLDEGPVEIPVGRRGIRAAIDRRGRIALGVGDLVVAQIAGGDHVVEHVVGAGAGGGQVDVRREFRRRLEQAGEHGRLREGHVLDRAAEIELRRRLDAERAAAHIGAVEIELEDLLLAQVRFQPEREEGLVDLARQGALVREEQVFRQLLGQGRAALHHAGRAGVDGQRAAEADGIDAPMVVEAAVLGREHRLDDIIGILIERHRVVVENAAPPDLLAEAVLERDGEIGLFQPVARGGEAERRLRQHDQDEAAEHAQRQALAGEFDHDARGAAHVKALHEAGEIAP